MPIDDGTTTENEAVLTTADENSAEKKTSSGDVMYLTWTLLIIST